MKRAGARILLATAFGCVTGAALSAAPTQRCNPEPHDSSVWGRYLDPANPAVNAMIAAARDPASNPSLHARLQGPTGANTSHIITPFVTFTYNPIEDPAEIFARVRADTEIYSQFDFLGANTGSCDIGTRPPGKVQVVTEYHNTLLNHYFLSSSPAENAAIDSGAAGPGWARTGETWRTYEYGVCAPIGYTAVYRFYGTPGVGPNSHFFTTNPDECGGLRRGVGWGYEGLAFSAAQPLDGACPGAAPVKVYRIYNNRWMQNDSNHRYTTKLALYESMQAQGWVGEGVQMCVTADGAQ